MPSETVNIKVVAKVRPLIDEESKNNRSNVIVKTTDDKVTIQDGGKSQSFSFDACHGPTVRTNQLYKQSIENFVHRALNGNSVSVIAIGATGSGKSHLLAGTEDEPGVIPCITHSLFKSIEEQKSNKKFFVTVSFVDIQDEKMLDVLNPHSNEMTIKEHPQLGIYVDGLSELVAHSSEDLSRLFQQGYRARNITTSSIKAHNARAAGIFFINIEQKEHQSSKVGLKATLLLAELPGLEAMNASVSNETKSMVTLKNVISAVKSGGNIPYRDSKVTRLLQNSIGGKAATMMLACLSPSEASHQNTLLTLQTAQTLRGIKNSVQVTLGETNNLISELRDEISHLRNKISQTPKCDKDDAQKLQALINDLHMAKFQTWDEKERMSKQYEEQRKINLANRGILEWVLDSNKRVDSDSQQQIILLQKESDQVTMEHRTHKAKVDEIKAELSKKITEYTKLQQSGKASDSQLKQNANSIHELKGRLRQETEKTEIYKQQLKAIKEKQNMKKQSGQDLMFAKANAEMRRKIQAEEFHKLELQHKGMIEDEVNRSELELAHRRDEIKKQNKQYSPEDGAELEMKVAQLVSDKSVVALQMQSLQQEKDKLKDDLDTTWQLQQQELEMQQLQHFQTFKQYREMFDAQKALIEDRYRGLLEESIHDAVYMSSRHNDLTVENDILKQEIAEMKDKLSKK